MRKSCHFKEDHKEKYQERNDRTLICYDIGFLMDSYNRFLKTYEYLKKAIKWQILIITVSIFNVSLSLSYHVATLVLDGVKEEDEDAELCLNMTLLVLEVVPFVIPCLLATQISDEVVNLKEIISSRVYENKLVGTLFHLATPPYLKQLFKFLKDCHNHSPSSSRILLIEIPSQSTPLRQLLN
ncbi:hypothetical protein KGM_216027 [Danaus plexippus plexippus]|uniref:Uncharacterized protein n=1 Tax=Danaus plexippus plexippus TaxID=278856 RepID=A0A212EI68_DANPL|nr:hypothetical protein KGM_216027 [Danaus plexippus plexippus]